MKKSGWLIVPAAFFFLINFSVSSVKILFLSRSVYFLFLIFLFFFLRKFDLDKILIPIVGGVSFIVFIYGIFQKFVLFPLYLRNITPGDNVYSQALIARIESGRIFSIFRLPTLYAIVCAVFIIFIFHYFLKSGTLKHRVAWAFLLVLGLFNLVLTQSFGGMIYFCVGVVVYLLLSGILKLRHLAPILMIFTLFFSVTIALRYSEARKMEPVRLRVSNWRQAVRAIESSPFLGVGLGNYESGVSYFTRSDEAKSIYAHNFILQFIAETGVFIPFFLLLLLIFSWKRLINKRFSGGPGGPRGAGSLLTMNPVGQDNGEQTHSVSPHIGPPRRGVAEGKPGETVMYISIFAVLVVYNLIDIGFYFFAAGLMGVVVLSQIYPAAVKRKAQSGLNLAILVLLSMFLVVESVSESYRGEAEVLRNQDHPVEAGRNYTKSVAVNPYNFKSLSGLALLEMSSPNREKGGQYPDRILTLYPDSSAGHYLKSRVELAGGHLFRAFYHAARAHEKNPIEKKYRDWYRRLKENLDAHLKRAGESEPDNEEEVPQ